MISHYNSYEIIQLENRNEIWNTFIKETIKIFAFFLSKYLFFMFC